MAFGYTKQSSIIGSTSVYKTGVHDVVHSQVSGTTLQVARIAGFTPPVSGMGNVGGSGSGQTVTNTLSVSIPAAANRMLFAYQFSNQSGIFNVAPTYPVGGVATSMTRFLNLTGSAYMAAWYLANPDSTGTCTFNTNSCNFYGTAVDCFKNVDQLNPISTPGSNQGAGGSTWSYSITTGMTPDHNLVVSYLNGWNKNFVISSPSGWTSANWAGLYDIQWRTWEYEYIPPVGTTSLTVNGTMSVNSDNWTVAGWAIKGAVG